MMLNSTIIGKKIAEARKRSNLSQAELANKISISPQAVGKWERGESMPDIITLNRLVEIFGLDLNYFSDSFQSVTNQRQNDKTLTEQPIEQLSSEPKKRFNWNWDMSNNNWVDADFSGLKDLKDKFSSSNIKNCKFVSSDLSGLTLKGNAIGDCDFSQSDIRNGKIYASDISESTFKEANLIDAKVQQTEIKNCDFDNCDFSGAEFINSNFQKNSIKNSIFKHTSFKNVGFSEITFSSNIEDCSFENCSFRSVKFQNAIILNSFFKHNRKFNRVEFIDCKVDKLSYAFLKSNGARLEGITIIEEVNK
jgi:uncharacterized protein YjbI with pentapeptide repeats